MKLYGIGNALLYYREQKGLSQALVCEGICTEMTISRIETGEREFESIISETLFSRIGKTANRFEFVLNDEDYHLCSLRDKIERAIEERNIDAARTYLREYEKIMPSGLILHEQFVTYNSAMLLKMTSGDSKEIEKLLHKAINMTRPDYRRYDGRLILFSAVEIKILYQLFVFEQYDEDVLNTIMQFVETLYDEEEKEKILIPFYVVLIRRYEEEERYEKMYEIAGKAINILLFGRNYLSLLGFYFSKARAEERINRGTIHWNEKKKN